MGGGEQQGPHWVDGDCCSERVHACTHPALHATHTQAHTAYRPPPQASHALSGGEQQISPRGLVAPLHS